MASTTQFINLVSDLIYGATITPNHRTWVGGNPNPVGTQWLDHHVGQMLPAFEAWLVADGVPPLLPWDGTVISPWPGATGITSVPVPASLEGSFTGITTEAQLSAALHNRLAALGWGAAGPEFNIADRVKAPYSQRYWGYIKWASILLRKFRGEIVVPPVEVVDRDGTKLSAIPFLDVLNELHWRFHDFGISGAMHGFSPALFPEVTNAPIQNTPKLKSTAGQRARALNAGNNSQIGTEFFRFHRDHILIYNRWLQRVGLPPVEGFLMTNATGTVDWPANPVSAPSTWVQANVPPWITSDDLTTNLNTLRNETGLNQMGHNVGNIHADGHNANDDIGHPRHNNYVPRFYSWHEWLDMQWFFREPRFGSWDSTNNLRTRTFQPVLSTGADWDGLHAISIVRDSLGGTDTVAPDNAVSGVNFITGAGTLKMRFIANDSYNRLLLATFTAEVFNDAMSATAPVETLVPVTRTIGPGGTEALNTEFTVDFNFGTAFLSDSPVFSPSNPVGFANSRVKITGTLRVNVPTDQDAINNAFIHEDYTEILLVKEKQGPQIDLYFNLSSFGEDQVNAAMSGGVARFPNALIVTVQDRTSDDAPITWPAEVVPEVRGIIKGFVPTAGLFDDTNPRVSINIGTGTGLTGVNTEPATIPGPVKEDPSLPHNLPQRFTYFFDLIFQAGHNAFAGLSLGGQQFRNVEVLSRDRSNNQSSATSQIKLFLEANPFMIDDDPSWLSIDTRAFRVFGGDTRFNATLDVANPTAFIRQVILNLRAGTTGGDTFDGLPTGGDDAALIFFPQTTDHRTNTVRQVRNFAVAKIRLRGAAGAGDVRAFFRLFRYTAPNLVFNTATGYRTFDQGGTDKIPLLGYSASNDVISIPFFASPRVDYNVGMNTQNDDLNVLTFPPGTTAEQVIYVGAYLDINDDVSSNAKLPDHFISAVAEQAGFTLADVTPIKNIFYDAHVCMVVEINYDGDTTPNAATPADSDNLAQRNLVVLKSDNPGGLLTHQVQHSFEVSTCECMETLAGQDPNHHRHADDHDHGHQHMAAIQPVDQSLLFLTQEKLHEMATNIAASDWSLLMSHGHGEGGIHGIKERIEKIKLELRKQNPLIFDLTDWTHRGDLFDELLFKWNGLPTDSEVEIFFPGINCENVVNMRNLRHAPNNVRLKDSSTLLLRSEGVTYLPVPAVRERRIPGIITISLPEKVKSGQEWKVDVIQLRGAEQRITGGFQLHIQVSNAELIAFEEAQLLELLFTRYRGLADYDAWKPVLAKRVATVRERAKALAESAGSEWKDPTVWFDPADPNNPRPLEGEKVRVVLEKIQVLDDLDPWIKGKGEFYFSTKVFTSDNGGKLEQHRFPANGTMKISDAAGQNVVLLDKVLFEGYVKDELRLEIAGTELDTFDPDDVLGKYTRIFCCASGHWLGAYGPDDESPIEPENLLSWKTWYRIERM